MSISSVAPASWQGMVHRVLIVLGLALMLTLGLTGSASAGVQNLTIDAKATLTSKTSAVVTGTIVCSQGENVLVQVNVFQNSGKVNVNASGDANLNCTGQVQTWAVIVNVDNGPSTTLKKGPASVIYTSAAPGTPLFNAGIKLG